jgi:hypothetical protein
MCERRGEPNSSLVWTYAGPMDDPNPSPDEWISTGAKCVRPSDAPDRAPAMSQAEFRRLPIPAGKANVEPSWRPVLINVETNLYVDAAPVTLRATVLGRQVEVEAIPTRFRWSFSDGERFTTQDPGAPYPNMSTTHTFTTPGPASVTLTTIYTGRFRVVGETEWLPVSGTAEVASPAVPLEVIEARAVLVP